PIQVYRIERGRRVPAGTPPQSARRGSRAPWIVTGVVVSLAAAGVGAWTLDLIPGLPSPQRAKAEAEAARQRAQAADAERQAQIETERSRAAKARAAAEAELSRARAEADATRRRAAAELAAAEEARRAAEA